MADIRYKRHLPHIHPEGYPLFITFRLADSLPLDVLHKLKLQREQEIEIAKQISATKVYEAEKKHFGRYDEWLDRCEFGPRWLEQEEVAQVVSDKLFELSESMYDLHAFCIMPNHGHILIKAHASGKEKYPIAQIMKSLKGSTARSCNLLLKRNGSFWFHESYDHYVRDDEELERIIKYILNNPVKAGLVKEWTEWKFSYVSPELGAW